MVPDVQVVLDKTKGCSYHCQDSTVQSSGPISSDGHDLFSHAVSSLQVDPQQSVTGTIVNVLYEKDIRNLQCLPGVW